MNRKNQQEKIIRKNDQKKGSGKMIMEKDQENEQEKSAGKNNQEK